MALVGYTPQGPGYVFHRDDGASQFLYGGEADRMKEFIDQSRPADARTASWNPALQAGFADADAALDRRPAPPPSVSDAGGMSAPEPAMSVAPPQPAPQAPQERAAPEQPRPAPSGPQPIQPPSGDLPPMQGGNEGPAGGADYRGATRDVVPQLGYGLLADALRAPTGHGRAAPAKMIKTEETIEGALSPEDEARRRAMIDSQRAGDATAMAEYRSATQQKQAAYLEQEAAAAQAAQAAQGQILDAQRHEAEVQGAWDRKYASFQKEQDAVARQAVDPRRLFHGEGGTLNAITSAIAVGLGAFGSSLTGGPNYAHQIVQASIDRDIAAQTDAIQRKGANANNAMSNFMRVHGMDVDEAKLAVKSVMQQYAGSLAQIQANRMGRLDSQQAAAEFALKQNAQSNKSLAELEAVSRAKTTDKWKLQQAGGGQDPIALAARKLALAKQSLEVDALREKMNGAGAGGGKLSARLGAQESTNESALEDLQNFKKNAPRGYVMGEHAALPRTDARIQLDAAAKAIVGKVVMGSNGSISQEEMHSLEEQLTDPREQVRDAAASRLHEALRTSRDAIERQRGNNSSEFTSSSEGDGGDR
jgi:hypothetical protein